MKILALWRVKGKVKLEGAPDAKADERDILIAVEPSFNAAQVMAEAEGAMLHHWSNQPHTAEIFSLEKTNTKVVAL